MTDRTPVTLTVNGETVSHHVAPRDTLADFLRQTLQLTGTHLGCEMGACGACLVLLDDRPIHACLMFAVQADGMVIETIEGLDGRGAISDLQQAFHQRNSLQCGFCTAGVLVTSYHLLKTGQTASREEIRDGLSGNYCRCTGYEAIVDAIETVARQREAGSDRPKNRPMDRPMSEEVGA
jgi:carbon-monoxide dehydrogenase small subunit